MSELLGGYELHHSMLVRQVVEFHVFLGDGTPAADHFFKGSIFVLDFGFRKRQVRLIPLFFSGAILLVAWSVAGVRELELDGGTTTADVLVPHLHETATASLGADRRLALVSVATSGVGVFLGFSERRALSTTTCGFGSCGTGALEVVTSASERGPVSPSTNNAVRGATYFVARSFH